MKVLVTGISGFIGRNFLECAPKDLEIIGIYNKSSDIEKFVRGKKLKNARLYRCDLTDKEQVENLFGKIGKNFENCIYLAANVNVPLSITNPVEDLKTTVQGLVNFLQSCGKISKFILMSSATVYEGSRGIATTSTRLNPLVPYSISKLMAEHYVRFFQYSGKIGSYMILRFGGAYGKYSEKKFVSQVVEKIAVQNEKMIEVYGDGTNIVNLMYAKDTIKALLACLKSNKQNITCNLGQDNMTITELIGRVAKIFNRSVEITHSPRRKDQKYIEFKLDVDFNKILSFKPDYSFEEGIREFAQLMKNES